MDGKPKKKVVASDFIRPDLTRILIYGIETFGYGKANEYYQYLITAIDLLSKWYLMHPECRHLPTKQRIYRNIITDTHLVIYRITENRIEVLRILHASSSIASIKKVQGVKI